ncbi:hypothetical protein CHCC5022_2886 [Bacillus paralicheniformis]|uniref:Uncharacterized protein n=1 Tax=Bacillus paralicheniformis TaxID=1648923 RepID=A0A7Z1B2N6_9BACI|nr:hypothetical protein B4121_3378 [Bacillus paralicheniformis]TWJ33284.1 hypothetical protein CHCC5027_3244 [Bacillus paralicheniformis]TWJ61471.1 hypothetical protein CHCC5022_2886 [Bacillus paralicheniformis]TWK50697.1 hypothetical protein CHCC20347_4608 [Bacillus paralicheniformis]TWK82849.1 hypothetical protein CHCC20333_1807 [Bacillus paralicheniformis]
MLYFSSQSERKNEKKLPVSAASARVFIYFCGFAPAIPFKT